MENYEYRDQDPNFEYYKRVMNSLKSQLGTVSSLRDHVSSEMTERLRVLAGQTPPIPDGDLIAYEQATNDVLSILDEDMDSLRIRLKATEMDLAEAKAMMIGTDSSEEIEMMKEAAKANTRRSKRSRYHPDSGTNYALEA